MSSLFSKTSPEERQRVDLFCQVVEEIPMVDRFSYRKKGRFEIIFKGKREDLYDPENQAICNLLAHAWIIIWGNDKAELHVGVTNVMGFRLEIDASKLYIGHKFDDHDNKLDDLLERIGLSRHLNG